MNMNMMLDGRWCAHDGHDHGRHAIQHDEPVAVLSPQMTSLSPPFSHPPFSHGRGRCDRVPWAHALRAFNSALSTRYARHPRLFAPPISALIATRRSSSHGPLTVHPAAFLLRVWRLQTLHLAASREDRLQMRQSTDRGRYGGGLGEIWASVIRSGDDAPGLSVGTCSAQRPGCQLGRARRSASSRLRRMIHFQRRWIITRAPSRISLNDSLNAFL